MSRHMPRSGWVWLGIGAAYFFIPLAATLEAVAEGIRTADLGGHHGTTAFTDEVIRRTRTKIEVWSSL